MQTFTVHPALRNAHAMTIATALLPRRTPQLPVARDRLFDVAPGTRLLARCHWQAEPRRCPTLVLVHGLEGSSESGNMRGVAEKAFLSGFNVLRVNQRNCGGTERLTPTLYNSGLSVDYSAVLQELAGRDRLPDVFFAGYSMGGNLVLKMAAELGAAAPAELGGVCAVCPALDLAACADAIARPANAFYQWHFVRSLKARLRRKARLFPGSFPLGVLARVRTVREFDDAVTAPCCGYRDADDYYRWASAGQLAHLIAVPTLVLTARDDPFVPFGSFNLPGLAVNPHIRLVAPKYGGHCGFISRRRGWERHWAEARIVEFCRALAVARSSGEFPAVAGR